jgi:hypothetical protein
MPNVHRHTTRTIRPPGDLWERFGAAVQRAKTQRLTVIVAFMRWYLRDPDAELPKRPPRRTE